MENSFSISSPFSHKVSLKLAETVTWCRSDDRGPPLFCLSSALYAEGSSSWRNQPLIQKSVAFGRLYWRLSLIVSVVCADWRLLRRSLSSLSSSQLHHLTTEFICARRWSWVALSWRRWCGVLCLRAKSMPVPRIVRIHVYIRVAPKNGAIFVRLNFTK